MRERGEWRLSSEGVNELHDWISFKDEPYRKITWSHCVAKRKVTQVQPMATSSPEVVIFGRCSNSAMEEHCHGTSRRMFDKATDSSVNSVSFRWSATVAADAGHRHDR